jgi:hypothetical protein
MDEPRASRGSTIRARAELLMPAKGIQILHDPDQRTAVVIQLFETAGDMAAAEGPLDEMDPADTPGTRASIDRCEIKAELGAG